MEYVQNALPRRYKSPSRVGHVPKSYEQLEHAVRPTDHGFPTSIHDAVREGFGSGGTREFLLRLLSVFGARTAINLFHMSNFSLQCVLTWACGN